MNKKVHKDRVIPIVSVFIGLVGVAVAIWAVYVSKNIAVQSGSLDKPVLDVFIGKNNISKSQKNELIIGLDVEKFGNQVVVGGIPVVIHNSGKKSLQDLNIKFSYHKDIGRQALSELMVYEATGGYYAKTADRHFSKMGSMQIASYHFQQLNPQAAVEVIDPLVIAETRYKERIKLNNGVSFTATVDYGIIVEIGVSALDMVPITRKVNVSVINASSLPELQRKHNASIVKSIEELREESRFWEYFKSLIFESSQVNVSYVYPEFELVSINQTEVYEADITATKLQSLNYEARQWGVLFD
jgi:hypothetical protein